MDDLVRLIEELTDAAVGRRAPVSLGARHRDELEAELRSIRANAGVDEMPDPAGAMPRVKQAVLRVGAFNWVRQQAVNRSTERALSLLVDQLQQLHDDLQRLTQAQAGAVAAVTARLETLEDRAALVVPSEDDPVPADHYQRFEDEFRPPGDELEQRLVGYVADLATAASAGRPILDLGCGRGDFLRVLARHDVPAIGVDANPDAIAEARRAGLDAVETDAITYLESVEPGTLGGVTALHLVEHLPMGIVVRLFEAARRALTPGGRLIVETPNPTNVTVGAAAFYNDPTHRRPMPPGYLEFAVRDAGFVNVAVRFLRPGAPLSEEARAAVPPSLTELLDELVWAVRGPLDFTVVGERP